MVTLKNPILGEDYQYAHLSKLQLPDEEIKLISEWCNKDKNMLVFCGNPGVGKTYFCSAYINFLIEKGRCFWYFHEKDFFAALRKEMSDGFDFENKIKQISEAQYLIIDDICSSQVTEFQKEALSSLIDYRSHNRLPTVITSNLLIRDFTSKISLRFASRLNDKRNTIIELNWIDKRSQGG